MREISLEQFVAYMQAGGHVHVTVGTDIFVLSRHVPLHALKEDHGKYVTFEDLLTAKFEVKEEQHGKL